MNHLTVEDRRWGEVFSNYLLMEATDQYCKRLRVSLNLNSHHPDASHLFATLECLGAAFNEAYAKVVGALAQKGEKTDISMEDLKTFAKLYLGAAYN